jgi:PIN domain nuclease of toxin-antitoxin system
VTGPVLVDTHLLLWTRMTPKRLAAAERALLDAASPAYVSIVTLWEIAILMSLGRLARDERLLEIPRGFALLELVPRHLREILSLPPLHRDPFDRMLIAQARADKLTLLTRDREMLGYVAPDIAIVNLAG